MCVYIYIYIYILPGMQEIQEATMLAARRFSKVTHIEDRTETQDKLTNNNIHKKS